MSTTFLNGGEAGSLLPPIGGYGEPFFVFPIREHIIGHDSTHYSVVRVESLLIICYNIKDRLFFEFRHQSQNKNVQTLL